MIQISHTRLRILLPVIASAALAVAGCSGSSTPPAPAAPTTNAIAPIAGVTAAPGTPATQAIPIPAAPTVQAKGYIVMDFLTGQVLAESNADERLEPASLTKLMSAYAVFHALKEGRIKLDDMVTISPHARDQDGSRMFVDVGTQVSVENLIQGLIVQSGNDATVALAEHVAGSEPVFVDMMNQYAQQLGMVSTHFENAPGMPAPQHYTTAHDIALVASALIRNYPEYYKYYSQREFTWNKIRQQNRNGLLERDPTVDGLKTGHTESAGYCLVSSAKRENMRVVSVVMGSPSVRAREDASFALLNYGFRFYETRQLYAAKTPVLNVNVRKGEAKQVQLAPTVDIWATIPRGQEGSIAVAADVPEPLFAPLATGKVVGKMRISRGDQAIGTYDLYPLANVAESGFFSRLWDDMTSWF